MPCKNTLPSVLLALMISFVCHAASGATGTAYVPVRNFSVTDYSGNAQNWGCVQDARGRLYVANGYGMLCFDGNMWRLYHLPNFTSVRTLMFDEDTGRIYAGGSGIFGYFSQRTPFGDLSFTSLSGTLGELHPQLAEVWNIVKADGKIWFQGDYHLFSYDGSKVTPFATRDRIARSCGIGPSVFVALDDGSLIHIDRGRMASLPGVEKLAGLKIMTVLPFANKTKLLIGTSFNGLFVYDGKTTVPFETDISPFLTENQLFCGAFDGERYVFGTVNRGAVVKNFLTGQTDYINKETGLLNNTVLATDFDSSGNIWLSLDYGLGYADFDTPLRNIAGNSSPIGAGYASLIRNGQIFLGTNQGLFSAPYPLVSSPSPSNFTQLLHGQIWSINDSGNTIFVGSDAGAYVREGNGSFYKIPQLDGTICIRPLHGNPDQALAMTYHGFQLLGKTAGRWMALGYIDGYDGIPAKFEQDRFGDIWLSHWRKGVYRLRYNPLTRSFDQCRLFDSHSGLPDDKNTSLDIYKDRIVVSTQAGFYFFNAMTETMQPDNELTAIFGRGLRGSFRSLGDSLQAVIDSRGVSIGRLLKNGDYSIDSVSFKNIGNKLIPGYTDIYPTPDRKLLLSGYEGFWIIDPEYRTKKPVKTDHSPFVSTVFANGDSLIYFAPISDTTDNPAQLKVEFAYNTLRFNFGDSDFSDPDAIEFSSFLEGYDDSPSEFSNEKSREYTRIPFGEYTLHLTSRNPRTGVISRSSIGIKVLPPWYRTVLADVCWILLLGLFLTALYFFISRQVAKSRQALEKKKEDEYAALKIKSDRDAIAKDMEIATLRSERLEQDIEHKSRELGDTTKSLIQKNEVLQDISAKLSHINELLRSDLGRPAAQRILAKLQQVIEQNLTHENDWARFAGNFDSVYTNFTKRLMELHPNLSVSDKRLCCYIRMGLSSKEIAPLINISYKSVEMARYRVRKKIGLAPGDSLTNYLDKL